MASLMQDSARFAALQSGYLAKQAQLWAAMLGEQDGPLVAPEPGDRRFAAKEWRDNPYYSYLKQSYLLASRFLDRARRRRRARRQVEGAPALRREAVVRRDVAGEFRGHQSGGAARGARNQGAKASRAGSPT